MTSARAPISRRATVTSARAPISGRGTLTAGPATAERPLVPTGELVLEPPPAAVAAGGGGMLLTAVPVLGGVGSVVLVATTTSADGGNRGLVATGMVLVVSLGFAAVQVDRQRRERSRQVAASRTSYLRYLRSVRQVVREAADQQRWALTWDHPAPSALPAVAEEGSRAWQLTPADEGFLHVRYGVCSQALTLDLVPPDDAPRDPVDPVAAAALHRLLVVHRMQSRLPASIDLRAFARVEVCGEEERARSLVRALVCSATAFHSPTHLLVAVLATERTLVHWDWLKWLPHAASGRSSDAAGPARMVTTSPTDLAALLPAEVGDRPPFGAGDPPPTPHILLVTDGARPQPGSHLEPLDGLHGVTVLDLPERWGEADSPTSLRLQLEAPDGPDGPDEGVPLRALRPRQEPVRAVADQCPLSTAEAFARRLAPLPSGAAGPTTGAAMDGDLVGPVDVMDLVGLGDVDSFDPTVAWHPRPARDRLRVPIGLGEAGAVVPLDLKESAQQGMGPHGLVIGATGSGKSELLRTLVLGLALTHSSERLTMVLVDFKGGATFAGMARLPHVSAVITNLAQELTLVDRMQDALSGEMVRRQELLRAAGNVASVHDYERARAAGEPLAPMPSLLIVVDEFSEMLAAKPEFLDLFVAIGRLGRSLGLHLLLASQRLEEGRLRGLESHLSYRIGLRTFSAGESRAVLGVPDAYELPPVPGLGYLRTDPSTLVRFQAAYVSGPATATGTVRRPAGDHLPGILPFSVAPVRSPGAAGPGSGVEAEVGSGEQERRSLLDVAVARMVGRGPEAHQVWLPPLDVPDTLDALMPDLAVDPARGLTSPHWRAAGDLVVPVGAVDRPREQRRDVLTVDLSGSQGHVAVVGGPRSGKSTLLRTLVAALALTTTPAESQFFVLDFGGGTFAPMSGLPHTAGIATRSEPEVCRRIFAEVQGIVERRERYFRAQAIDSIETYRSRRAEGRADDGWGDVFLIVDGWATLSADVDDLERELQHLATRGLTFGVHVAVGASRWADLRAGMRDVFGTRVELRMGDPMDSEIDRRVAALVPPGRPGRGLVQGSLHVLGALPRVDGDASAGSLGAGVDDLVARVADAWNGPAGPKLRLLPERISLDAVRARAAQRGLPAGTLLLGINERELAPVGLDPDVDPHLLVLGDGRSGKSSLLRGYVREVMRTRTAREAQVVVVDYRRSLLGEVPDDYRLDYLTSATQATPALRELASYLEGRLPGPDVTAEQLRQRSWWTGAEVFVVVDDDDLVATAQGSPVQSLQPLLAQARDVGLHLVVARRSGGAARALHEPVLRSLRDLAVPGLLLSGSPEEGPLLGALRPAPAAPGRGRLVTRDRGVDVVQLGWTDPAP